MKLYYSPGACSLCPHIALIEGGFSFEKEKVDLATKKTETGADFAGINAKGYVPALQLNDGQLLTEVPAILQYLADQVPEKKLSPPAGSMERYRLQEWLNFISTELHKAFGGIFRAPAEFRAPLKEQLARRLAYLSSSLEGQPFLMGDAFSVADAYSFTVLSWHKYLDFDLSPWPALGQYMGRISARPAVVQALEAEGLAA